MWASLARYEWLLVGLLVLGLALVELALLNRSMRRDRKAASERSPVSRPSRSDGPPPPGA